VKILILSTCKIEEYDDSYAARLIEQGRAVLPPIAQEKPAARKPRKADIAEPEEKTDKE
jgi:hypothetical protein